VRGSGTFLTAEWRHLAMLNFRIDPAVLRPYVPAGTELDCRRGEAIVSVVGFRFLNTRLRGIAIPRHRDFEEVNLRFYVRREEAGEIRRGVTFLREFVPRRAIATLARFAYNEPYKACPMRSAVADSGPVEYAWRIGARWNALRVRPDGQASPLEPGSEAEFITEHYWGYTRQRDGETVEYEVRHPPWRVWRTSSAELDADAGLVYGNEFAEALSQPPCSAFLAQGSEVSVLRPRRLTATARRDPPRR
jgi:uncharacterized protein